MTMKKGRKISGGRYHKQRKKKLFERAGQFLRVKLGKEKRKTIKTRNGKLKTVLLRTDKANLIDKSGKAKVVTIKNVLEVPSNRFLARQNIIVKGAIIETDAGKARVTNKPSQEGCVNAFLIE